MELDTREIFYISKYLEGFLYGIYSGVFALYLRHYAARKLEGTSNAILFYALCVLYILSTVIMTLDMAYFVALGNNPNISFLLLFHLEILQPTVFGCCEFIAQSILIYRCWIVWGRSIRVVTIPIIIAVAFLVLWMAGIGGNFIASGSFGSTVWSTDLTTTSLVMSMTLNALVTGLIAFRIFKGSFREVKPEGTSTTLNIRSLGITGGRKLRYVMFVVIESGMALFSIQLARVVSTALSTGQTESDEDAFNLIVGIHEMLNGITPTIILVRVSMGLSFHDETSLVEAVSSFRFAADDPYPIPVTRSIKQENDICESDACDDIQILERS